jgi:uncharacterized membrane protein YebE (DUF533 family)
MFDAKNLLDQFLGAGAGAKAGGIFGEVQRQAAANPLASSVVGGALAAILLGSDARGVTGNAVKYGGLALIGSLAYKAWQDYQAKQPGGSPQPAQAQPELQPPPANSPFSPAAHEEQGRAELLLGAMIAAAKSDGHIDATEQSRISGRLDALGLDPEAKTHVMDQLRAPVDIDAIVSGATQPEVATAVYAASLLAIDPDQPAEKAYLQMLAARLGLSDALVQEIHKTAEASRAAG